jgi:hypothetical protein
LRPLGLLRPLWSVSTAGLVETVETVETLL